MVWGNLTTLTILVKWLSGRIALLATKQSPNLVMHYENSIRIRLINTGDLISFPLWLFISYNSADLMSFLTFTAFCVIKPKVY